MAANHPNSDINLRNGFARKRTGSYLLFLSKSGLSANDRLRTFALSAVLRGMNAPLDVYVFRDPHFAASGDTLVCIAEQARLEQFMTKKEVAYAFSGCATYRRWDAERIWLLRWMRKNYVGVWGKKNASRLRRFLRERGAELVIHRKAPSHLRLAYCSTESVRRRVRELPESLGGSVRYPPRSGH